MAENDPKITVRWSEIEAMVQKAVLKELRKMGIVKDQVKEDSTNVMIANDGESKKDAREGEASDKIQAQVDKLNKLMEKCTKEDKNADLLDISLMPKIELPPKFKMPEVVRFDGTGDPKVHVRHYIGVMRTSGLEEREITYLFPLSLTGAALTWYYTLKDSEIENWGVMVEKFVQQYAYNTEIEVTRRELEETTQGEEETFSAFVKRWRVKASKMLDRPSNEELNKMLLNCLNLRYYNAMYMIPIDKPFSKFYKLAMQIEDGLKLATSSSNDWAKAD